MKYNKFIFNDSSIRKRIIIINGFMSSLIFIILLSLSILILFKIILFISFLPIVKLLILNIFIKSSIELNEKNILIKVSNITIKCEVNDIKELIIAKNGIGIIFHDIDNIISNAVINKLSLWEKLVLPLLYIPFSWRRPDKFFQNENNIKKFFRNHYNITGAHFICSVSLSEEDLIDIERLYFNNKLLKISKEDSIYARKPISFVEPKITLLTILIFIHQKGWWVTQEYPTL